jgi:phosphoribosyl-AMP cyclohydrolase
MIYTIFTRKATGEGISVVYSNLKAVAKHLEETGVSYYRLDYWFGRKGKVWLEVGTELVIKSTGVERGAW